MSVVPLIVFLICSKTSIKFPKLHKSIPASGSSKIVNLAFLSATVAISILFNSPPDNDPLISLSTYSLAHSPTFDKTLQASTFVKFLLADIFKISYTVIPLNFIVYIS